MPTEPPVAYGPIRLRQHAVLDALLVVLAVPGPFVLGYAGEFWPTAYTYGIVTIGFGLNLATRYPGGLFGILPMKWHRRVELSSPGPFILVPWLLFPAATEMKWLLTGLGVAVFLNALLTCERRSSEKVAARTPRTGPPAI